MSERGFLLAGPVLYAAIGAGAIIVGLSVALKVQSSRLEAAKADLHACRTNYDAALQQINRQNAGIRQLEEASKQALQASKVAQERAKAAQAGMRQERTRLAALKPPVGPCPAGGAVSEIRRGLKP